MNIICTDCSAVLEILRMCRKLRLRCSGCGREYHLHEVADQFTDESEELLDGYNAIIYD